MYRLRILRERELLRASRSDLGSRYDLEDISSFDDSGHTCNLDWSSRTSRVDTASLVVFESTYFTTHSCTDDIIPLSDGSRIYKYRGDRPELLIEMSFDDCRYCESVWIRLELKHLCLEKDHLEECIHTETRVC